MSGKPYSGISEHGKAGKHRRQDAQVLHDGSRWRGAMYIGGYAVECLLKARLMRIFGCRNLEEPHEELTRRGLRPEGASLFMHGLEFLLRLTGGLDRMRADPTVWTSFSRVNRWVPGWRYDSDVSDPEEAGLFLEAVDEVTRWVEASL